MPHCQLCDFCETTGTPSNHQSDFHYANNKVKYYPEHGMDLCLECKDIIQINCEIYKDDFDDNQQIPVGEETPTVPDVHKLGCLCDT